MNISHLFTSFEGRIRRRTFWLAVIALVVVAIVLQLILGNILSVGWAQLVAFLILVYPACAVYAKRLHDRNKPNMPWLAIIFTPGIVMMVMQSLEIGFQNTSMQGTSVSTPAGMLGWAIIAVVMIVSLWVLVELGFLSGTQGDNEFGPDPKAQS